MACCLPGGECVYFEWQTYVEDCAEAGGILMPEGFLCEWYNCLTTHACCLPDGSCQLLDDAVCNSESGEILEEYSCDPNPCVVNDAPEQLGWITTWGRVKTIYR